MMVTVKSVKNRHFRRFLEHIVYFVILVVLIPVFFYFELVIVLPTIAQPWTTEYCIHILCALFLLFNFVGNLIYGMFTDTSIRGKLLKAKNDRDWSFCTECESFRPPRAWHCELCNICILKRDHHCTFFATCVGYYNYRYFFMFTTYMFIGSVYAFCYNIKYVSQFISWNYGLAIIKFVFPFVNFFIDFSLESLYLFLVVINAVVAALTGFLFFYHIRNLLSGKTSYENNQCRNIYSKSYKENIIEVFGYRWYIAWILPFIPSPLPGNGIVWDTEQKIE